MTTAILAPSTHRSTSSKDRSATASPLTAGEVVLQALHATTKALLKRNPHPSEADVLEALRYNLCRCGAHIEIMRAAMRAAGHVAEAGT